MSGQLPFSTKPHMDEFTRARIRDWWPCACVKGGSIKRLKPSTHIKLNAPSVLRCKKCGATKENAERLREGTR